MIDKNFIVISIDLIKVRQFFKCFPEDKVPFLNSIGEKYRIVNFVL